MVKLKKLTCIFAITFLVLSSCNLKEGKIGNEFLPDSIRIGKIRYYEDSSAKNSRKEPYLQNIAKMIGLPAIQKAKEGQYVRIWLWDQPRKIVINIAQDSLKKECIIVEFNIPKTDSGDYLGIHNVRYVMPNDGWRKFFQEMEELQIPRLNDGVPSRNPYGALTSMSYINFEIESHDNYRYYEYLEPAYFRFVDSGSNNVYRFLKFFDEQMNLKVYNPDSLYVKPKGNE